MLVAIDFDDTFTADSKAWRAVIEVLRATGHQVICVSARADSERDREELKAALPKGVHILLSEQCPKRVFAMRHGYDVDIWIEDTPLAVDAVYAYGSGWKIVA